jgi:ABC-type polysaccharide/polyol phosphate transport system ATPase subunit
MWDFAFQRTHILFYNGRSIMEIKIKDLTRSYRTGGRTVTALNGISLTVKSGEAVAVIGRKQKE